MPRGSLYLAHVDGPPCDARHSSFHPGKNSVLPTFHLLRISYIRNSVRSTFHLLRISYIQNFVRPTFHLLRIFHIRRLTPDGRGGRFNFPGQTCPNPLVMLARRTSAAKDSDSPDILARQTLAIRRIHFRPQKAPTILTTKSLELSLIFNARYIRQDIPKSSQVS